MKLNESLIEMLIEKQVLKFGSFKLNSGRISPYFFNLGAIDDGSSFYNIGLAYARRIYDEDLICDVLFGPAYKGIPIAVSTAIGLKAVSYTHLRAHVTPEHRGWRLRRLKK